MCSLCPHTFSCCLMSRRTLHNINQMRLLIICQPENSCLLSLQLWKPESRTSCMHSVLFSEQTLLCWIPPWLTAGACCFSKPTFAGTCGPATGKLNKGMNCTQHLEGLSNDPQIENTITLLPLAGWYHTQTARLLCLTLTPQFLCN